MARQLKRNLRGIVEPFLLGEPLFVRLCSVFVNYLALILRTAFIVGSVLLFHEFRDLSVDLRQPVAEIDLPPAYEIEIEPTVELDPEDPLLTERVQHFLNCTYEDYRTTHFDECVDNQSEIHLRPPADPDDTGSVSYDLPLRYASLDDYFSDPMQTVILAGDRS